MKKEILKITKLLKLWSQNSVQALLVSDALLLIMMRFIFRLAEDLVITESLVELSNT